MIDQKSLTAAIGVLLFCMGAARAETSAPDGTLLSSAPCPANTITSYEEFLAAKRDYFTSEMERATQENIVMAPVSDELLIASIASPEDVADHIAYEGFECRAITYASDGLVIAGYLWKPGGTKDGAYPLIIANRGGNAEFGPMTPWRYWGFHDFLKAGYVVLASQYRGGPGSEGADEFGGRDLDDVRALVPLAENLGFVDLNNVFLWGGSRGGMMSYMLAREGIGGATLRAIGIRAGAADFVAGIKERPEMETYVFAVRIPDYEKVKDEALRRRSAALWADEIEVPAIIFHGSDDWRVNASNSLAVVEGLRKSGTPYELHLYAGDTHAMTLNEDDMIAHAVRFFDRYRVAEE